MKTKTSTEKEENTVDLIASGYEWICPSCQVLNREIEALDKVTCLTCRDQFDANPPEHALP